MAFMQVQWGQRQWSHPSDHLTWVNARAIPGTTVDTFASKTTVIPFANTRPRRRTAFAVLLFWLFAVASGVANACLIQPGQSHVHGSAEPETLQVRAHMVSAGHLGADAGHPANTGAANSACRKFVGDGTQTLVKLRPGIDLLDIPMAPPFEFAWTTRQTAAAPTSAWQELSAPGPALPLRTRFSRLTL